MIAKPIKFFPKYDVTQLGIVLSFHKGRPLPLKPAKDSDGYLYVHLFKNKKPHRRYIHHLVLETFIGPCPKGMECCHGDGDPSNNEITNLRWGTRKDNVDDRQKHNRTPKGEKHYASKLSDEEIYHIREFCREFGHGSKIKMAKFYRVGVGHIGKICRHEVRR